MNNLRRLCQVMVTTALVAVGVMPLLADGKVTSAAIYPPDIHLTNQQDLQRFRVMDDPEEITEWLDQVIDGRENNHAAHQADQG